MRNGRVSVSGIDTRFQALYNCLYCVYPYNYEYIKNEEAQTIIYIYIKDLSQFLFGSWKTNLNEVVHTV